MNLTNTRSNMHILYNTVDIVKKLTVSQHIKGIKVSSLVYLTNICEYLPHYLRNCLLSKLLRSCLLAHATSQVD